MTQYFAFYFSENGAYCKFRKSQEDPISVLPIYMALQWQQRMPKLTVYCSLLTSECRLALAKAAVQPVQTIDFLGKKFHTE